MIRKSLYLKDITVKLVDDIRTKQRPVLSFSAMSDQLITRGSSGFTTPLKQELQEAQQQAERVTEILPGPDDDILTIDEEGDIAKPRKKPVKPKKTVPRARTKLKRIWCDACGTPLESDMKYCDHCGREIIIL